MPMQQMLLGAGAVATKTYVDDVFSTYVYTGTGSARSINTGIDMTEGGLVWIKDRSTAYHHSIQDTVRGAGATKKLSSNLSNGENSGDTANHWAGYISSFNNNGFSIDKTGSGAIDWANYNKSGDDYASFSFRKTKGFFTIKQYTGSGSTQSISHDLGSIPGAIFIKCTSASEMWGVYHRGQNGGVDPWNYRLKLDSSGAEADATFFGDTAPTATHFTVGDSHGEVNTNGATYIAYLFAGGESEAATARSVKFIRSSSQTLAIPNNDDFNLGTGDYTVECWVKLNSGNGQNIWAFGSDTASTGMSLYSDGSQNTYLNFDNSAKILSGDGGLSIGQWHHVAVVRNSGTAQFFIDGNSKGTSTQSSSPQGYVTIGASGSSSSYLDGNISNFRVVKGTAVYTSSFRPPTEPLTNITNTKLLCCNDSSTTGSTVTPDTISANGSPTASTDSPFDDPAAFTFGENGDQGIVKCGSYVGSGSAGLEVNVGFESQWVLWKRTDSTGNWFIHDSMRGIVTSGDDPYLLADVSDSENPVSTIDVTPTGFKITTSGTYFNASGGSYIWMAIRRPDGYVGKPPELGTDVFSMDAYGTSNGSPSYVSSMSVVDMAMMKKPTATSSWFTTARLVQGTRGKTDSSDAFAAYANTYDFDFQNGWSYFHSAHEYQSWMWKRHAGFDVVTYKGNNTAGSAWSHNLGKIPEMIWIKNRGTSADWAVGHKGLNGGTNPWNYRILLNSNAAESSANDYWGGSSNTGKPPTSTHFFLGSSWTESNANNNDYIAMLFASVDGISKVGSYTGNGSTTGPTITTGFSPRFLIIKGGDVTGSWFVYDTTRGFGSGNDQRLWLESSAAQYGSDRVDPSSTGFQIVTDWSQFNGNGNTYIYYAHA